MSTSPVGSRVSVKYIQGRGRNPVGSHLFVPGSYSSAAMR